MIVKIIRKSCIALIFLAAVFISTDCKKQIRCGCGKDVYKSFTSAPSYIYFNADKSVITSQVVGVSYGVYNFCNPSQMADKLADTQYGDIMLVTGKIYYDCTSVYQQSNQGYNTSLVQYFQLEVTDLELDMYGKKSGTQVN
jgi:hypothetical protein